MLATLYGSAVFGVDAHIISIEVNILRGARFSISGLPDNSIKESAHRVESAIRLLNYKMPRTRVVVNLAPADIRKEGTAYDLPIALAVLQASEQFTPNRLGEYVVMGELSLEGSLRPVKGSLSMALEAKRKGFKGIMLPAENAEEAGLVEGVDVLGVSSLKEAILFFSGKQEINPHVSNRSVFASAEHSDDFSDVQGQETIKRSLEIAAAGGHNAIMIGPPGSGKTMLARRITSILPPISFGESLETTKVHSVAGLLNGSGGLVNHRPFRTPHHTISHVAMVGGGSTPQPGEISLAHNGILFLDELPEFPRIVLEVLRQPMESRMVTVSRARMTVEFPADFMLIASMNPCPCGYFNHPERECVCAPGMVQRYLNKISGPLLDRIDLHVEVTPVPFDEMIALRPSEKSEVIRNRVIHARKIQQERFRAVMTNAAMSPSEVKKICQLNAGAKELLRNAVNKLGLSVRAYDRILKVSRTIADLDESENIETQHLAEAIQYRSLDRESWNA